MRIGLLIAIRLFGAVGFVGGTVICVLLLASNRTVNGKRSYLYPLIPFDGRALFTLFFRVRKGRFSESRGIRYTKAEKTKK